MSLVAQDMPGISLSEPAPSLLARMPTEHYASADISTDSKPPIS
jgi:hypothetical protein